MKAPRQLALALLAVAGVAAVASLVLTQLEALLSQWFLRIEMPAVRLGFTRWVIAPLLSGLVSGAFGAALFRTRRWVLPLAPTLALVFAISVSWLCTAFGFRLPALLANHQWRALFICLPLGGVLGLVVVRRLYPAGRG